MKALSFIKKGASFVFKPLTWAVGAKSIKDNNQVIYSQIKSLRLPRCPECHKGTIEPHPFTNEDKTQWECNNCHWFIRISGDEHNLNAIHDVCNNIERENTISMLNDKEHELRLTDSCKKFMWTSRAAYTFSMILGFTAVYFAVFSQSITSSLSALSIGVYLFTLGMTSAYRSWQITTKTVYEDGSFISWLKEFKWFI